MAGKRRVTAAASDAASLAVHHLEQGIAVKRRFLEEGRSSTVVAAATAIADAFRKGRKLLLCGNGGSAADCQHIAAEFVSLMRLDFSRPALPAIALTTDTSLLTGSANDFGFEGVFARQVEALGAQGDVLLAISTSGKSKNVLAAVAVARTKAMRCIAFTGDPGGPLAKNADVAVRVPSDDTQLIQECHIAIAHIVCEIVETRLFGTGPKT